MVPNTLVVMGLAIVGESTVAMDVALIQTFQRRGAKLAKIRFLDIESHGSYFKADSGFIFCMSYKDLGEKKVHTVVRNNVLPDPYDDKALCKQIYDVIGDADMIVTHNGKRFDIPFINTRLLIHDLPPLPNVPHFDTCEIIFKKLKMSGRLDNTSATFGWKLKKHGVEVQKWFRAAAGNKAMLKEIVKHCEIDVKLLEKVYLKLRPLGFKHPNIALINEDGRQCPICGKKGTLQSRGWLPAQVNKAKRYQCTSCGGWSHARYEKVKGVDIRL